MQTIALRICETLMDGDISQRTLPGRAAHRTFVRCIGALLSWRYSEPDNQYPVSSHEISLDERILPCMGMDECAAKEVPVYILRPEPRIEGQPILQGFDGFGLVSGPVWS